MDDHYKKIGRCESEDCRHCESCGSDRVILIEGRSFLGGCTSREAVCRDCGWRADLLEDEDEG